mmetsp:Transcript_116264/g.323846  ORF Transcript_116264/g.323846 Transcript_116264/m.323846 type:complete len:266 (+) Transcript_116264:135-932(+)
MFKNAAELSPEDVRRGVKWLPYTATPKVTGAYLTRGNSVWTALMVHTRFDSIEQAFGSQGKGLLHGFDLYSDVVFGWALFHHADYAGVAGWKKTLWLGFFTVSSVLWMAVAWLVALHFDEDLKISKMMRSRLNRIIVQSKLWFLSAFGVPISDLVSLTRAMDSFILPEGASCTFVPVAGVQVFVANRGPTLRPRLVTLVLEDLPLFTLNMIISVEVGCTFFATPAMLLSLANIVVKARDVFEHVSNSCYAEISLRAHYEALDLEA